MTSNYRPAATRASDADRDAVVSDLSEHFQAGRLTAAELDERTGRALTARTWGELGELAADLPALRPAAQAATPAVGRPQPPARHGCPSRPTPKTFEPVPEIAPMPGCAPVAAAQAATTSLTTIQLSVRAPRTWRARSSTKAT